MNILEENRNRNSRIFTPYDPITGEGSLVPRFPFRYSSNLVLHLPNAMRDDPIISDILDDPRYINGAFCDYAKPKLKGIFERLRQRYDAEYVCNRFTIQDRVKNKVRFTANRGQRRLFEVAERQRHAGKPIRIDNLKTRRGGGTTFAYLYTLYLSHYVLENADSTIVGLQTNISSHIVNLVNTVMQNAGIGELKGYSNVSNVWKHTKRNSLFQIGTTKNAEAISGFSPQIGVITEIGKATSTLKIKADDTVTNLASMIPMLPNTLILLEGSAKGSEGVFWQNRVNATLAGETSAELVFMAWHDDEFNWLNFESDEERLLFFDSMQNQSAYVKPNYEMQLWEQGLSLEQIHWYRRKRKDYPTHAGMMQEFPNTPDEAFTTSEKRVFASEDVQRIATTCTEPLFIGEIEGKRTHGELAFAQLQFKPDPTGAVKIWRLPNQVPSWLAESPVLPFAYIEGALQLMQGYKIKNRFICATDPAQGLSEKASWSVSIVLDTLPMLFNRPPEVVATMRCKRPIEVIAWQSAQLAWFYNALWVPEVNLTFSHTTDAEMNPEPDGSIYLLDQVARFYPEDKVYIHRSSVREIVEDRKWKYGFLMNPVNREEAIDIFAAVIRSYGISSSYIERDTSVIKELGTFIKHANGKRMKMDGAFDDQIMCRAILFYVVAELARLKDQGTSSYMGLCEIIRHTTERAPTYHT